MTCNELPLLSPSPLSGLSPPDYDFTMKISGLWVRVLEEVIEDVCLLMQTDREKERERERETEREKDSQEGEAELFQIVRGQQ